MNHTASPDRNVISNATSRKNRTVSSNPYVVSNGYSLSLTEFAVVILVMVGGGQNRVWPYVYVVSKRYSSVGIDVDADIISRITAYTFYNVLGPNDF